MSKEIQTVPVEVVEPMALTALQEGEINSMVATAKRFPRSLETFRKRALGMVTLDKNIAQSCYYKLKRGGKVIEGPSVRLAEIALACWGNLRAGARVISVDDCYVRSQGAFMDCETNSQVTMEVLRRITDKDGNRFADDMIIVTANAANAIAFRNAAFKVIPGVFVSELLASAKECARGDLKTLEERRSNALEAFDKLGVPEKKILTWLGRKGTGEIDLEDLENLFGLHTAIKDGETTIAETFWEGNKPKVEMPTALPEAQADEKQAPAATVSPKTETNPAPVQPPAEKKAAVPVKLGPKQEEIKQLFDLLQVQGKTEAEIGNILLFDGLPFDPMKAAPGIADKVIASLKSMLVKVAE